MSPPLRRSTSLQAVDGRAVGCRTDESVGAESGEDDRERSPPGGIVVGSGSLGDGAEADVAKDLGETAVGGLHGEHGSQKSWRPPNEQAMIDSAQHYQRAQSAYAFQQTTRPQTVGRLLADNPVGLAAWIYACRGTLRRRRTTSRTGRGDRHDVPRAVLTCVAPKLSRLHRSLAWW